MPPNTTISAPPALGGGDIRVVSLQRGRAWVRSVGRERAWVLFYNACTQAPPEWKVTRWLGARASFGGTPEWRGTGIECSASAKEYAEWIATNFAHLVFEKGDGPFVARGLSRYGGSTDAECIEITGIFCDGDLPDNGVSCSAARAILDAAGLAYFGQIRPGGKFHLEMPLTRSLEIRGNHDAFKATSYSQQLGYLLGILSELAFPLDDGRRLDPKTDRLLQPDFLYTRRRPEEPVPGTFYNAGNRAIDWPAVLTACEFSLAEIARGDGREFVRPEERSLDDLDTPLVRHAIELIAQNVPEEGGHDLIMALAGMLWARGADLDDAEHIISSGMAGRPRGEVGRICASTWSMSDEAPRRGFTFACSIVGEEAAKEIGDAFADLYPDPLLAVLEQWRTKTAPTATTAAPAATTATPAATTATPAATTATPAATNSAPAAAAPAPVPTPAPVVDLRSLRKDLVALHRRKTRSTDRSHVIQRTILRALLDGQDLRVWCDWHPPFCLQDDDLVHADGKQQLVRDDEGRLLDRDRVIGLAMRMVAFKLPLGTSFEAVREFLRSSLWAMRREDEATIDKLMKEAERAFNHSLASKIRHDEKRRAAEDTRLNWLAVTFDKPRSR